MKSVLGILGGLGPLASADFLLSLYEYNMGEVEQDSPAVILYSDPTFPDRTEALLGGDDRVLLDAFRNALAELSRLEVGKIVVACVTIHYLLPRLPRDLRRRVIPLTDVILSEVAATRQKRLLICTKGTRAARIFESHERWPDAAPFVVFLDEGDQNVIHEHIYRDIKTNAGAASLIAFLAELCMKYGVDSFIAACTELHRVTRLMAAHGRARASCGFLDPLLIIAQNYKEFLHDETRPAGDLRRESRTV
jgi:aspartate racemase